MDMNDVLRTYGSDAVKKLFLDTVFEGLAVKDRGSKGGVNLGIEFKVAPPSDKAGSCRRLRPASLVFSVDRAP